jgi:multimeric flavodoxin WrbA
MKVLTIIWHSRTGAVAQMVHAMRHAASAFEVQVNAVNAQHANAHTVLHADGVIFACPENLGSMTGCMKEFFDRSYYAVLDQANGKPYAIAIAAGSDGSGAACQIERIATGWRLKKVADTVLIVTNAQSASAIAAPKQLHAQQLAHVSELAATLAAGLEAGIF